MVQRKCTDAIIDNLFYDVTPHYRNIQLEKIVGKAIKHNQVLYSEEHNAAECCAITAEKVSENQKPIYYAATAYSILYCNHNISEAIYWCKKSLELLECYHRDYIILDAYKWFYNEPLISRLLFDDNGYSNIPNNPLKIPNNYL